MRPEQKRQSESGRVITFRPRSPERQQNRGFHGDAPADLETSVVADLQKYQQAREKEDYRHRMVVNALALAFSVVLAFAGAWLVNEIAEMKRVQDCVLAGRTGCIPLPIPQGRSP
jgi:hypothetical protein